MYRKPLQLDAHKQLMRLDKISRSYWRSCRPSKERQVEHSRCKLLNANGKQNVENRRNTQMHITLPNHATWWTQTSGYMSSPQQAGCKTLEITVCIWKWLNCANVLKMHTLFFVQILPDSHRLVIQNPMAQKTSLGHRCSASPDPCK